MGALITFLPAFPARRPWTRGLAIVLALALFGAGLVQSKLLDSLSSDLVLGLAVTAMIWVTLHCATAPLPAFYVHVARRAAHSSYTLYLVHLPMLIFLKATLHLPRAYPGWHVLSCRRGSAGGYSLVCTVSLRGVRKKYGSCAPLDSTVCDGPAGSLRVDKAASCRIRNRPHGGSGSMSG